MYVAITPCLSVLVYPFTDISTLAGVLVDAMNWSCVEVAVAIFIACIPSFKTFISYRFPTLQRLLGLASKDESIGPSKLYGSSTRRTYNGLSTRGRNSIKLKPVTGHSRADVETSHNGSQERIMHAGIQVTTDVSVQQTV